MGLRSQGLAHVLHSGVGAGEAGGSTPSAIVINRASPFLREGVHGMQPCSPLESVADATGIVWGVIAIEVFGAAPTSIGTANTANKYPWFPRGAI